MHARDFAWPALPLDGWRATYETLHMWLQIVGKTRLALSPHVNHWWEAPLYLTSRGLTTSPIPYEDGTFEARFDFIDHFLALETSWGPARVLPLREESVAAFYGRFFKGLGELGIEASIWPVPVEASHKTPFDSDRLHAAYDPESAHRCWRVLASCDRVFKEFRGRFLGKASPVHLFWGSFDLAATRFSGRPAPPRPEADGVTREAYSQEVLSAGWWPGGRWPGSLSHDATFYAYAAPEPAGFSSAPMPPGCVYDPALKGFYLPYEEVRRSEDPKAAVLAFMQAAYDAGAELGGWDRSALEKAPPWSTA